MRLLLLSTGTLFQREVVRFLRQRNRVIGALATPLVFWLFIGAGMGQSFRPDWAPPGFSYLEYFFPGTLLLMILFTAIFSTISLIEDRREGFLQAVLVSPAPRLAIVLGKVLGGSALALGQGGLLCLLAPLGGIGLTPSGFFMALGAIAVLGAALTAISFLVAWPLQSVQGFHAVMNLFLMPLWLLSGALFPATGAAGWMRPVMELNPLSFGLVALRHAFYPIGHPMLEQQLGYGVALGILGGVAVLAIILATRLTAKIPGRTS
jgi:ABC-2 type transport system permease protein